MKKFILFLPLICLGFACQKGDNEVVFQLPLREIEFTIPAGVNPLEAQYFNIDNVPTNALALFDNFGLSPGQVQSITPASARITAIFGNVDYDFVYEFSINICEAGDKTPNCGREVFWRVPVPLEVGSFVDMAANESDLKDLLSAETVNIQVKLAQLRSTSPQFVESLLEMEFNVK